MVEGTYVSTECPQEGLRVHFRKGQTLRSVPRSAGQLASLRDLHIVTPMALAPWQPKGPNQADLETTSATRNKVKVKGDFSGKNRGGDNKGGSPGKLGKKGHMDDGREQTR